MIWNPLRWNLLLSDVTPTVAYASTHIELVTTSYRCVNRLHTYTHAPESICWFFLQVSVFLIIFTWSNHVLTHTYIHTHTRSLLFQQTLLNRRIKRITYLSKWIETSSWFWYILGFWKQGRKMQRPKLSMELYCSYQAREWVSLRQSVLSACENYVRFDSICGYVGSTSLESLSVCVQPDHLYQ